MSGLLLDTHAFLWWLTDDPRLTEGARLSISDAATDVHVSAASAWEIATKHRLGKLSNAGTLVHDFESLLLKAGFEPLAIRVAHALRAGTLPGAHRDPFDRMIAAQALCEGLVVVTLDAAIGELGARCVF